MSETITLPGLVDVHVHLREPSDNKSETIQSGTMAAALGGYALISDMPNNPGNPTWTEARMKEKHQIAQRDAYIPVGFAAGSQPESDNIGELEAMSKYAIKYKIYGDPTTGNDNTYEASDFAENIAEWHRVAPDKPIFFHAGKENLEDMIGLVARNTGHALHVCHVNSPDQVELVTAAKKAELPVTCGVCPHHLLKTSYDRNTQGVFAEMQPPLAHQDDAEKLMHQVSTGEIDLIESDHAPHSKQAKWEAEYSGGKCYGVPGIEHIVPLMLYQVKQGYLTLERLVDAMSTQPAKLLGLRLMHTSSRSLWELEEGRIESETDVVSQAGWTPYLGMLTGGKLIGSKIHGLYVVRNGKVKKHTHLPISDPGTVL
jgi:dihydroorotase